MMVTTRVRRAAALLAVATTALGGGLAGSGANAAGSTKGGAYTYTVGTPVELPREADSAGPLDLAVDPTTHTVYVADRDAHSIDVIDGLRSRLVGTIDLGADHQPLAIAIDPIDRTGYVIDRDGGSNHEDTVKAFDLDTYSVTGTTPIYQPTGGIAVDPGTHTVYATQVHDPGPEGERGPTSVEDGVVLLGRADLVAVDTSTHVVFVANHEADPLTEIDPASGSTTRIPIETAFPYLQDIAVDPATRTAYVTNINDGAIVVIDEETHAVTDTILAGKAVPQVATDPGTRTIYGTSPHPPSANGDGQVLVIDGTTNAITQTLDVGRGAYAIAVDPTTHTAYVGNQEDGTVQAITQTPVAAPGRPAVTRLRPAAGPAAGGKKVVLVGSGFTGATSVRFGSSKAAYTVVSDTKIVATSPAHATGTVTVRVRNQFGASPLSKSPTYRYR